MNLMDVTKGTKFKLSNASETSVPPSSIMPDAHETYTSGWLDGMYCNALDSNGNRVYFAAWTEVDLIE